MTIPPYESPMDTTWPSAMEPHLDPSDAPPKLIARAFGRSDVGKVRSGNEDQFLIASPARTLRIQQSSLRPSEAQYADVEGEIFVVADGMGGHAGGAQASAIAVGAVEESLLSTLKWLFALGGSEAVGGIDLLGQLKAALRSADASVCDEAARHPELRDMGTTLTMAYRHAEWLFVAHVGDSRCYLFRNGTLHRLTQDHTLVGDMVRRGMIDPEAAASHGLRHVITNAVGGPTRGIQAEVHRVRLASDDVVLLCTDGLTEMVADSRISNILRTEPNPRAACDRLVDLANDQGGVDNITVIVARFESAMLPREEAPEPFSGGQA